MARGPIKLHLGCGPKHLPGFVNVDLPGNWSGKAPDVEADLTKPLPFPDEYADEIHAYHVFEHFYRFDTQRILNDWVRVLRPGGLLVLEMPCLDQILKIYMHYHSVGKVPPDRLSIWALYGDPTYENEAMCHKWCYSVDELRQMMEAEGLTVKFTRPETHIEIRDMRAEGVK